jgi:NAD(P)H-hydrate repair Nnr-like enzyme with NAD(P)H-hydrate epimerase domain
MNAGDCLVAADFLHLQDIDSVFFLAQLEGQEFAAGDFAVGICCGGDLHNVILVTKVDIRQRRTRPSE